MEFDSSKRDGKCTTGSTIDKSNWALPKDSPPFRAYAIACGIRFTYGGLKIDPRCAALNADDAVLELLSFESLRQIESERFSPRRT